jgi:TolB-like protein
MLSHVAALALSLAFSQVPNSAPPKPKWSMAVLPLADRGVGKELADLLSETVAQEAHKLDGPRVIGMNEVKAVLGLEAQKQMLGCAESQCMAEIAGALGVDKILTGWVGKVGESWLLNLKVVNVRTTAVEAQSSERVTGGRGEEYLDLVGPMVEKLFPEVPVKPGQVRGVAPTLRAKASSERPANRTFAWVTGGTAVATLAAGLGFGLAARSAQDEYDSLTKKALSEPVAWSRIQTASDSAKSRAQIANVLYIGGGALGVTSVVLFAFSGGGSAAPPKPGDSAPAVKPTVLFIPVPGGAVASLQGRF